MKKRRELDALVNGKLGRRKKRGQHELLRNTDSSEVEEFSVPQKAIVRKRSASRFCSTCLGACGFFLLAACVVAIGGLVWVHIELKKDVDHLRTQLRRVETGSQGNPEEFQTLHTKQQELDQTLQNLQMGANGLAQQQKNISDILKQIALLNATTASLSKSLESAPQLKTLPKTVQDLSQNVAKMGSDINTLQQDIQDLLKVKSELNTKISTLSDNVGRLQNMSHSSDNAAVKITPTVPPRNDADQIPIQEELSKLAQTVINVNTSINSQLATMKINSDTRLEDIVVLQNTTMLLDNRLAAVEHQAFAGTPTQLGQQNMQGTLDNHTRTLQLLRSQLDELQESGNSEEIEAQLLNMTSSINKLQTDLENYKEQFGQTLQGTATQIEGVTKRVAALENKPIPNSEASSPTSGSGGTGDRSDSLLTPAPSDTIKPEAAAPSPSAQGDISSAAAVAGTAKTVHADGIDTYADVQNSFYDWDSDHDDLVAYEDITNGLGDAAPSKQELVPFDFNKDGLYDLDEVATAFGFQAPPPVPNSDAPQKRASDDQVDSLLNAIDRDDVAP